MRALLLALGLVAAGLGGATASAGSPLTTRIEPENHWQLEFIRGAPVYEGEPEESHLHVGAHDDLTAHEYLHDGHSPVRALHPGAVAWRSCEIVASGPGGHHRGVELSLGKPVLETRPVWRDTQHDVSDKEFVVCRARSQNDCLRVVSEQCVGTVTDSHATESEIGELTANDELFEFSINGPANNRIGVVFMGDGYTAAQREDYIADMRRLVEEMFTGVTFKSYLPTMNIYGVFRPSTQTGIGSGGRPRDTSFGLYRDGTELRGVYTSKPQEARNACRKAPACHFPSLIGNDNYYGGLGGEFTITTRSIKSGTVVLRHEMGHNFVYVGEEYDGGQVYRGVNWAGNLNNLGWKHWLTEPTNIREETAEILVQDYAWYDLSRGAYRIPFTSKGGFAKWYLVFTVSGAETPGSISVTMDGQSLNWESEGDLDRTFYRFYGGQLAAGRHELVFQQMTPPANGNPIRQLCSVTMHEYAAEPEFHWEDDSFIGAFRTYRQNKVFAGYRPNNEFCLMRNMTSPHLCVVCQEGMWMQFLQKMSLIDAVDISYPGSDARVKLELVPLGQLRPPADRIDGERYEISWTRNGEQRYDLKDRLEFSMPRSTAAGKWKVEVHFKSPEIRSDPRRLTQFTREFTISA